MKKSKKMVVLIIVIVLLAVGASIFLIVKGIPINHNKGIVKDLYSYIGNDDLWKCNGLVFYDNKKIDKDNISSEDKVCLAYIKLNDEEIEEVKLDKQKKKNTCLLNDSMVFATDNYDGQNCSLMKVSEDIINDKIYSMFNEKNIKVDKFMLDNTNVCYYFDGSYYCGLSEEYTYTFGALAHTYRAIKSAYKKNDNIVIYDYFLKTINDECYSSYVNGKANKDCNIDGNVNYKSLKKNGGLYKHIFKKNDNGYYWVSSEIIK